MTEHDRHEPLHARLAWAQQHLARLREAVNLYEEIPPYAVTDETTEDGQTRVVRAEIVTPPPIEISLALGDVAHQLRAALDNAVGAMRDGGPTRRSAFVITSDPANFEAALGDGRLTGLPSAVLDVIRMVQPFPDHALGEWMGLGLERLDALAQHDRHRAVLLRAAVVETEMVEVDWAEGTPQPVLFHGRAEVRFPVTVAAHPHFKAQVLVAEDDPLLSGWEVVKLAQLVAQRSIAVIQQMERAAGR